MNEEKQKIENVLNLAFDATQDEREKSMGLNVGYDSLQDVWEVIVKCSTNLEFLLDGEYSVVNLSDNYFIIQTSQKNINALSNLPEIEYIEKPKRLFFERLEGKLVSCVYSIEADPLSLQGEGIIIGILDSGIDYQNMEFRNDQGKTRILNLWDQTLTGNPPKGYLRGVEYTREEIDLALESEMTLKSMDVSGHGTEVASIAAGRSGVAPKSELVVVKLGVAKEKGFPRTTELMEGLDYLIAKATEYKKPLVVNISIGNTYGSHQGESLLERFIGELSNNWKTTICVGVGNEGSVAGHVQGSVKRGEIKKVELVVDLRQVSFDLQFWKRYEDELEISFISPRGERVGALKNVLGTQRIIVGNTELLIYYGEPSPYHVLQEIYCIFVPINTYVDTGIWTIEIRGVTVVTGEYSMWLPSAVALNKGTQFNNSSKEGTFTIPSTTSEVVSVGAYNAATLTYAEFSGRGSSNVPRLVKPDILAPGVNVRVSSVGGMQKSVSGTSYATPFVTGGAALLMEWGIVKGNDPFLYGQKVKAYLRKGAKALPGYSEYPNEVVGFGRLCVRDSLPV